MDNAIARHKQVLACSAIPAEVLTSILRLHMYAFQLQRLLSWGMAYCWQECPGCKRCASPPLVPELHFTDCTPGAVKMASAKPCSVKRKITARDTNSRSDHLFFLFALTGMFSRDLYNLINFYLFHFKSLRHMPVFVTQNGGNGYFLSRPVGLNSSRFHLSIDKNFFAGQNYCFSAHRPPPPTPREIFRNL